MKKLLINSLFGLAIRITRAIAFLIICSSLVRRQPVSRQVTPPPVATQPVQLFAADGRLIPLPTEVNAVVHVTPGGPG